jgi:hypothetical protein
MVIISPNNMVKASNEEKISDEQMKKDIEETQKENEQKKKCLENDNKYDYCDKTSNEVAKSLSDIAEKLGKLSGK